MLETCKHCGRSLTVVCRNTRDMHDFGSDPIGGDRICFAALMFAGGGEYTTDRWQAEALWRAVKKEPVK